MVKFSKKIFLVLLIMNYGMTMENHYNSNRIPSISSGIPSLKNIIKKGLVLNLLSQNVFGYNNNEYDKGLNSLNISSLGLEINNDGRNLEIDVTNNLYGKSQSSSKSNSQVDITSDLFGANNAKKKTTHQVFLQGNATLDNPVKLRQPIQWHREVVGNSLNDFKQFKNLVSNSTNCLNSTITDCVFSIMSATPECQTFLNNNSKLRPEELINLFYKDTNQCTKGFLMNFKNNITGDFGVSTHEQFLNVEIFNHLKDPASFRIDSQNKQQIRVEFNNSQSGSQVFSINGQISAQLLKEAALLNLDKKKISLLKNKEKFADILQDNSLFKVNLDKEELLLYNMNPFLTNLIENAIYIRDGHFKYIIKDKTFMTYFSYSNYNVFLSIKFQKNEEEISMENSNIKMCFEKAEDMDFDDIFDRLMKRNNFAISCFENFEINNNMLDIVKKLLYKIITNTQDTIFDEESFYTFEVNDQSKKTVRKIFENGYYNIDLGKLMSGNDDNIITPVKNNTNGRLLQDDLLMLKTKYSSGIPINIFPAQAITVFIITISSIILSLEGLRFLLTGVMMAFRSQNNFKFFDIFSRYINFYNGQYTLLTMGYIMMLIEIAINLANESTLIIPGNEATIFALQLSNCIILALTGGMMLSYKLKNKQIAFVADTNKIIKYYRAIKNVSPSMIDSITTVSGDNNDKNIFNILDINYLYTDLSSVNFVNNNDLLNQLNKMKEALIGEINKLKTQQTRKEQPSETTSVQSIQPLNATNTSDLNLNSLLSMYTVVVFAIQNHKEKNPSLYDSSFIPGMGSFMGDCLQQLNIDMHENFPEILTAGMTQDTVTQNVEIQNTIHKINSDGYLVGQRALLSTGIAFLFSLGLTIISGLQR